VSDRNLLVRLFSAIWSGVEGVRKILHLLLLLFIFILFFSSMQDTSLVLPDRAALVIEPYGFLVEEIEGHPFDRALAELAGDGNPQTLVQDIIDALNYAKEDDRIEVVYIELSSLLGGGLSKLQRIAAAMEDFKTSGKPVIASADYLSQQGYYIAAHADEVYLHPEGMLLLRGYGRYRNYFSDAIELLRIDWNVFRVGTHKSFVEPYTRMDMSDEDRESTLNLVDQLWSLYQVDVETARDLDNGTISEFADQFLEIVEAADGDIASAAAEYGLVDELLKRTEVRELLFDHV
jgi:protease-4